MAKITKLTLAVLAAAFLTACQQAEPEPMVEMEPEPIYTGKP